MAFEQKKRRRRIRNKTKLLAAYRYNSIKVDDKNMKNSKRLIKLEENNIKK